MSLAAIWFVLIGVLLAGYAILDGFDLGVGTLYPFLAKDEDERRTLRDSIGPVWDGNEVWLLTAAGALFAAFPMVYATVFSGFYLALMLVLFSLIFRAVSLEFRAAASWPRVWDAAFFVGSALPALLFGVAIGNIVRGIPIGPDGEFSGTFFTLLNPFALLVGATGLAMFVSHGAAWVALKANGALQGRARTVLSRAHWVFVALVLVTTAAAFTLVDDRAGNVVGNPLGWLMLLLLLGGIVRARLAIRQAKDYPAFQGSTLGILGLVGLLAVGNYPDLVPALDAPERSLSITNASSSDLTLTVMLVIALIGVPIVIAYTALVYWTFRGKTAKRTAHGGGY